MRNRGVLKITEQLLKQMMGLKSSLHISGIEYSPFNDTFSFLVNGPGLPEVAEGCQSPYVELEDVLEKVAHYNIGGVDLDITHTDVDFLEAMALVRKGYYITRPCDDKVYHISPLVNQFNIEATYIVKTDQKAVATFLSSDIVANDWIVLKQVSKKDTELNLESRD